jgi:hypothetical protein
MVKNNSGIDAMTLKMYFEMEMFRCSPSRTAGQSDNLAGFHFIPDMY